jgi:hypothetical protein
MQVRDVRRGHQLLTVGGEAATVLTVVKTRCHGGEVDVVRLESGLIITPYHPVRDPSAAPAVCQAGADTGGWAFPTDLGVVTKVCGIEWVYTFVLGSGHTVLINGVECVTLGHGLTADVVRHPYFGSSLVVSDLRSCAGWTTGMVALEPESYLRSSVTGMICCITTAAPASTARSPNPVAAESIMTGIED